MSWIGGKKALRDVILQRFPLYYEKYIEVFGGGGWVLFHKPPGNDFEVYNDFNGLLTNLYRCVRDQPQALISALRYGLNSREDFDLIKAALARDSPATEIQKAVWFYQIIRYSYSHQSSAALPIVLTGPRLCEETRAAARQPRQMGAWRQQRFFP